MVTIRTLLNNPVHQIERELAPFEDSAALVVIEDGESGGSRAFRTQFCQTPPAAAEGVTAELMGKIHAVRKRPGGAFSERVGLGRATNTDVALRYPEISKYHAFISKDSEGKFTITDAGSRNGTFVNGRSVADGKASAVKQGDIVQLGVRRFVFVEPGGALKLLGLG